MSFVLFPSVVSLDPLMMATQANVGVSAPIAPGVNSFLPNGSMGTDRASAVALPVLGSGFTLKPGAYEITVDGFWQALALTNTFTLNATLGGSDPGNTLSGHFGGLPVFVPIDQTFVAQSVAQLSSFSFSFGAVIVVQDLLAIWALLNAAGGTNFGIASLIISKVV